MPFLHGARAFTRQDIESLNPNEIGVYGIYNQYEWIYVGKGNLRARLLAHLNGDNPCITRRHPTNWTGEVFQSQDQLDLREQALIVELNPTCNQRVG